MAIFKPEIKEFTEMNKFTGVCKFAIMGFKTRT